MKSVRIPAVLVAVLALAAVVTACGDDDDGSGGGDGGGATPTSTASVPAGNGSGDTVAVLIEGFAFDPAKFTVPAGVEVTFQVTNADSSTHTFTVYKDAEFNQIGDVAMQVDGSDSSEGSATFEPGEYYFKCTIHPNMEGEFTAE